MKLVHVNGADDWQGVYIDGKLVDEDHSTRWEYAIFPKIMERGGHIESFDEYSYEDDDENGKRINAYVEENCCLPEDLNEIVQ